MDTQFLSEQEIELTTKIGEGSFGQVYSGFYQGKPVAIKVIQTCILSETTIIENVRHPNIVKFIKYLKFGNNHYLIMELANGGCLTSLMNQGVTELEASTIMRCLLSGVQYLHSQCVVHRDIKPDNILLLDSNDYTSLRIVDFGLSFQYSDDLKFNHSLSQKCGTLIYMAPEQILNQPYNKSVDLWSCGIVMYMLLSNGKHPFYPQLNSRQEFVDALPNLPYSDPPNISILAKDLIRRLLRVSKNDRYTAPQAMAHPWITRRFEDMIPMNVSEFGKCSQNKDNLILRIKQMMFMSYLTKNYQEPSQEESVVLEETSIQLDSSPEQSQGAQSANRESYKISNIWPPHTKYPKSSVQFNDYTYLKNKNLQLQQILNPIQKSQSPKKSVRMTDKLKKEANSSSPHKESKSEQSALIQPPSNQFRITSNTIRLPQLPDSSPIKKQPLPQTFLLPDTNYKRPLLKKSQSQYFGGLVKLRMMEQQTEDEQGIQQAQAQDEFKSDHQPCIMRQTGGIQSQRKLKHQSSIGQLSSPKSQLIANLVQAQRTKLSQIQQRLKPVQMV